VTLYQGLDDPLVGHATEADWQAHIERLKTVGQDETAFDYGTGRFG